MSVLIGTSGYSYEDWVGTYYPQGLNSQDWLSYYARDFQTTELNFAYYCMPNSWQMKRIADKVPSEFKFSVKAFQRITHEKGPAPQEIFRQFSDALQPLVEQNKLACILMQFPWSFQASERNYQYLSYVREQLHEYALVVEFRYESWLGKKTFEYIRSINLAFCCVDQPTLKGLLPPIAEATAEVAYIRFHGRNKEKWWQHAEAWERYDYTYSDEELEEWVPKIRFLEKTADMVLIYANNHWRAQAVATAVRLKTLLRLAAIA